MSKHKNDMTQMRELMMGMLGDLSDPKADDNKDLIERARAMTGIGKVLVDSAKVEVAYVKQKELDVAPTNFIETSNPKQIAHE